MIALPDTSEGRQLRAISRGATPDMTPVDKSELVYALKSIIRDEYIALAEIQDRLESLHELEGKLKVLVPVEPGEETPW